MDFMNKTYKASEVVKRAKQLADIANTDFISFEEDTAYLNDAFTQIFNKIVDKGDKQFIKEVELACNGAFGTYTEYALPEDCYQIVSLKNKYTGALVERHAESQGINSGTYDIINNRLRLYGIADSNLVLTYWTIPKFLSFPKETKVREDLDGFSFTSLSAGNTVLLDDTDKTLYNVKTGETIGKLNGSGTPYLLGNGCWATTIQNKKYVKSWSGTTIKAEQDSNSCVWTLDEFFNIGIESKTLFENDTFLVLFLGDNVIQFMNDNKIKINDGEIIDISDLVSGDNKPFPIGWFDDKCSFIIGDYLFSTDGIDLFYEKIKHRNPLILAVTSDGLLTSNYNQYSIESWVPDTLLNFPKEIYFSLLSAQLGLMYLSKSNGESSGLADLYQNYWNTFMDSLSQAGAYTRIKNVYGARF